MYAFALWNDKTKFLYLESSELAIDVMQIDRFGENTTIFFYRYRTKLTG